MGGGVWDSDLYKKERKTRRETGREDFAYSSETLRRPRDQWQVNPLLDPRGINGVRESRDSDEHPETRAIAVCLDVTGSMRHIPRIIQKELENLMEAVKTRIGIEHPQLLTAAVGDSYCDAVPFQISQFESDNRIDEQIRALFLEGGGGPGIKESYGLGYYAAGWKTSIDCLEQRKRKGYLFTIGDEEAYPTLTPEELSRIFGEVVRQPITIEAAVAKAAEKYEIFHIIPAGASHGNDAEIERFWRELLGQRVLRLKNPSDICGLIVSTIAACEGENGADGSTAAPTTKRTKRAAKRTKPESARDAMGDETPDEDWRL